MYTLYSKRTMHKIIIIKTLCSRKYLKWNQNLYIRTVFKRPMFKEVFNLKWELANGISNDKTLIKK